jgi:hypothetical protein
MRRIERILGRGDRWVDAAFTAGGDRLITVIADGVSRTWDVGATPLVEPADAPELDRRVPATEIYQRLLLRANPMKSLHIPSL